MNLQFYIEKLKDSQEFGKFKKENPDCYLCGGFFAIDLEDMKNPKNQNHLDYFSPSLKKFFNFKLDNGIEFAPVENYEGIEIKVPDKILENLDIDFEKIEDLVIQKIQEENPKTKIQKIILSLQSLDKIPYFVSTIFVSGMGIVKMNINLKDFKISSFEKKSLLDMFKIIKKK